MNCHGFARETQAALPGKNFAWKIFGVMKFIGVQGTHPEGLAGHRWRLTPPPGWSAPKILLPAVAMAIALAAGGCGFKTPPRPAVEALPPTADFLVRQRGGTLLVSWRPVEPKAAERFGGVRGYRFLLQRHPVFCGVCPPDSSRTVTINNATTLATAASQAGESELRREGGRLIYRLSGKPGAGGFSGGGPALLRVRMVTVYGSGENRPTGPALLEPPAPMAAPRLMWRWTGAAQGRPDPTALREAQLYWKKQREGVLRVIGADGLPFERETFLRANLYRRPAPAPWPLTPLNSQPLDTGRWSVTRIGEAREAKALEPGGVEYVLRWIDRFGNEGPPSTPVRIGQPEHRP